MRYPFTYTHNINMNGNVKISNNWSLSFNSGYDFQAKEITQTSCTISRDLHCFNLSASLSPFGRWKYYNVTIRANASILQDLKYEQRSQTQSNIQWYQGVISKRFLILHKAWGVIPKNDAMYFNGTVRNMF